MRQTIFAVLACLPALAIGAAPEGRWEGQAQIPGRELRLVVDLQETSAGVWIGSIIVPGLGIKGAALSNIAMTGRDVAFDVADALSDPKVRPPTFRAHLDSDDGMAGEMSQGGNVAKFSLAKIGPPQVDRPPRSTAVTASLEGKWSGEYEMGGYPRQVTITLENHGDAGATAQFVIVGKRTNQLPVTLVVQDGNFVRIESPTTQVNFEGRLSKESGEINGTVEIGSVETPLALRRVAKGAS